MIEEKPRTTITLKDSYGTYSISVPKEDFTLEAMFDYIINK